MLLILKKRALSLLDQSSLIYKLLAYAYSWVACRPPAARHSAWRALVVWITRDSRFNESEVWMATSCPRILLDAVVDKFQPRSILNVGCGTGEVIPYVLQKGIERVGLGLCRQEKSL